MMSQSIEADIKGLSYGDRNDVIVYSRRAVYRNFAKGGRIWGMEKRGGAEAL